MKIKVMDSDEIKRTWKPFWWRDVNGRPSKPKQREIRLSKGRIVSNQYFPSVQ